VLLLVFTVLGGFVAIDCTIGAVIEFVEAADLSDDMLIARLLEDSANKFSRMDHP